MAGLFCNSGIVVFSGGCFSGKTTTIETLHKVLINKGYKVYILSEIIRKIINEPIDKVREDPVKYFEIQKKIITKKINQEKRAFKITYDDFSKSYYKGIIFLTDRAITDSIFYFENYVEKSKLQDAAIIEYCKFHKKLRKYAYDAFKNYNVVVEFKPLKKSGNIDKFRPKNIDFLKTYEYYIIHTLNKFYATECSKNKNQYFVCDLNKQSVNEIIDKILNALRID